MWWTVPSCLLMIRSWKVWPPRVVAVPSEAWQHAATFSLRMGSMCIEQASGIDWNAVGAIATAFAAATALLIWVLDSRRRRREQAATARLLAQVMVVRVSATQLSISKLRQAVAPENESPWLMITATEDQGARVDLADMTANVRLELPEQFLDRADVFSEILTNRLALALAQVSRLQEIAKLSAEIPDNAARETIAEHLTVFMTQLRDTEQAINEALAVLLKAGRSSFWLRLFGREPSPRSVS